MSRNLIHLGKYGNKDVSFDTASALNQHILILGKPGGGKSVEAQKIILELAKKGKTVLVLDLHSVLAEDQIFQAYRSEFKSYLHEVDAYHDGIPCDLFSPVAFADGEYEKEIDTAGAILDVIARTKKLGSRQHSTLRQAIRFVMESGTYETAGFKALDDALDRIGSSIATVIREKIYPLTAHNVFRAGKMFIEPGKINVVRLSKFDLETQEIVAEVLLSFLWRLATASQFRNQGLYIFVDEVQNLAAGKGCALAQILAEGRKFNVNAILATQQVSANAGSVVQQRMMQAGLILMFQPNSAHVSAMARIIDPANPDSWLLVLRTLSVGEFVALGRLQVDGLAIEKPLKVSAKLFREQTKNEEKIYAVNGVMTNHTQEEK